MSRIRSLALWGVLSGSSVAFAGDGYFPIGYGVKAQGMGGVGIALPQDGLAAATNQAGMAFVSDRADFGLTRFSSDKSAQITDNAFYSNGTYDGNGAGNSFIPEFGYIKKINQSTTAGVAVYKNGGTNTQYASDPYSAFLGNFNGNINKGIKLEQWFISPSVAYKPNDNNALGLALNFAYQRFSAQGLRLFYMTSFSSPGPVSNQAYDGTDTSTGWGIRLGWTGQVTPDLTLGATWASKINTSKFNNDSELFANGGSMDIPENYGVGLAYKFASVWTFAADISQIKYASVNSDAHPLSNLTLQLDLPNGLCFVWNDITVVKLGVSYDATPDVTLRAGYNHSGQAIPGNRTYFNILAPATVQDHLTFGGTWKISKGGELSAAYTHGFKNTINGVNSIPGGLYAAFGGGNANISTAENSLGVAYGWKF